MGEEFKKEGGVGKKKFIMPSAGLRLLVGRKSWDVKGQSGKNSKQILG